MITTRIMIMMMKTLVVKVTIEQTDMGIHILYFFKILYVGQTRMTWRMITTRIMIMMMKTLVVKVTI